MSTSYLPGTTSHIKSSTRSSRTVMQASRRYSLIRSNLQRAKSVALSASESKQQTIITICDRRLVNGPASAPVKLFKGIVMKRRYLETIHKEVDVVIPRQVVDAATQDAK